MFRKLAFNASLIAILFVAALTAFADDRYSAEGSGELREGDDTRRIQEATIELRDNDHFILTLRMHNGSTQELRGTYSGGGHHRNLNIRRGLEKDELSGSGEIEIADNSGKIKSLNIHGAYKSGKQFSVDFARERQSFNERSSIDDFSLSDSVTGSGRVERLGRSKDIDKIQVRMSSNGDLNLRVDGFDVSRLSWDGRWTGDGPTYDIELRHSSNGSRVRADGKLTLSNSRRSVRELRINGTEDGEEFKIRFDADSSSGSHNSSHSNNSNNSFDDSGRFSLTDTLSGSGSLKIGEDDHRVSSIRVHMSANNELEIHVEGPDFNDMELEGSWSGSGMEYAVNVSKSSSSNARGTGTLMLSSNKRHVRSLELSGKAHGLNMHLAFSAE